MTARPARRSVLAAAVTVPLVACTADASGPDGDPSPSPPTVDPDVALRAAAVAREQALLAAYDAALAASPTYVARLSPVRAEHAAHLAALQETADAAAPAARRPAASAPGVAALVTAERAAARAHAVAARTASPGLAQVLASLSACEATHEIALAT